jgi:hypothetical protein
MSRTSWNKGYTKETHPSVAKISRTMRRKKLDNFSEWRDEMRREGKIPSLYPPLAKNGDLAELIGVILGDGYLGKFPRTEVLRIISNSNNKGFIERYERIVESVFGKKPSVIKRSTSNAVNITLYQRKLSSRLEIPLGAKGARKFAVPIWIIKNRNYIKRYLRGLYEAEGSFSTHPPTYTYKFSFSNLNPSLLKNVYELLVLLGFHPHCTKKDVQISKKVEVYKAVEVIEFRYY